MVSDATFEFASPEWLAAVEELLQKAVDGLDLGGKTYTISEEFTDPPAHLLPPGATSISWHLRVTDSAVEVGRGVLDDSDLKTTVDYQAVLPVARLVYESTPEAMADAQRLRAEARQTGERVGDETALPPQLLERLVWLHNELARRTR